MKTNILFILTGAILITACSIPTIETSWSKPGATQEEFEKAHEKCDEDQGMAGLPGEAGYDVCMKRQGWFLIEENVQ